ncbi:hypothetical protein [Glycomyces sp. NPDC048151]|uniref:hypothetical protein n=1 Tax=Glycomyces sp. NPDC048151 TaxID=3364002 RepID=UPI00371FF2C5
MALTLTYHGDFSRVRIEATGLPGADPSWGDAARIWPTWDALAADNPTWGDLADRFTNGAVLRSTDTGRTWQSVRGADRIALAGGVRCNDFEFTPGVENRYRIVDELGRPLAGAAITPELDAVWLKCPVLPFLNLPVDVLTWGTVTRAARAGVFEVVGRAEPVVVTAPRSSREWTLTLVTDDLRRDPAADAEAQADRIEAALAPGEVMLLHVPAGWPVPGGYVHIGDAVRDLQDGHVQGPRIFELPCRTAAAPAPELPGAQFTWAGAARAWTTWAALAADNGTWADVADRFGVPEDLEPGR